MATASGTTAPYLLYLSSHLVVILLLSHTVVEAILCKVVRVSLQVHVSVEHIRVDIDRRDSSYQVFVTLLLPLNLVGTPVWLLLLGQLTQPRLLPRSRPLDLRLHNVLQNVFLHALPLDIDNRDD